MRITENSLASSVLSSITQSLGRLARVQEKLATTKNIVRPSDDPLGAGLVLRYQATAQGLEAFQRAIQTSREFLGATETALDRVSDLLTEASKTGLRGANEVLDPPTRASLGRQIDQLLEELVAQGNTRFADRYVFGGTQTSTPPFAVTRDASGRITAVTPNPRGIGGTVAVGVAEGSSVQANLPGDQVFLQTTDLFGTLIGLRDALEADNTAGIVAANAALGAGLSQVQAATGVVGVRAQRLDRVWAQNAQDLARIEECRSRVQDADVAELYVEVQKMERAFQASLAAGSKALQASLLDYLR
ncbi:MAG: flagellar hook-associated protein FlgL [Candidatus Methylomirabilales bacterium]